MHITVGSTTVRIKEPAARELRDAMVQAMVAIDRASATVGPAPTPAIHLVPSISSAGLDDDDDPKVH